MINTFEGGISSPVVEEVMFTAAENSLEYPSSSIFGPKIEPMAEAAATDEPAMAPKSIAATMLT